MQINNDLLPHSQADAAWKDVLEDFLEEAIAFSFPNLYHDIDWMYGWDFLDKELQAISPESVDGARFVDKLIRVHLKNGKEKWLLIHIEVQGNQDPDFAKRMFIYHYRSFDKFGLHPVSCAILTDNSKSWRPDKYEHSQSGCELFFKFPILKLLDLELKRELLEVSKNPFECILIAQLNAIKLKKCTFEDRYHIKLSTTKQLYEKGFSAETIRKLFHFIDALIRLPENFELKFKNDIVKFEETKNMAYISSIERIGYQNGVEQGMHQGIRQVALRMLRKAQPLDVISDMTGLNKEELTVLMRELSEGVKY